MSQPHLHTVADSSPRFEAGKETVDNGPVPPTPPSGGDTSKRASSKARADKALPTDRLKFDNQVRVLRAVAVTSGNGRRGVTADAMSAAIDLSGNTGGLNSRFFRSAGWFDAVGRGEYTASPGLLAYNQHITIDPDAQYKATELMRQEASSSWFWQTLYPMLSSGQPISVKLALLELAKAAGASNHTLQLETIIEWLVWVGLVTREGDQIRLESADSTPPAEAEPDETAEQVAAPQTDVDESRDAVQPDAPQPGQSLAAGNHGDADAIVSFNMSVRLTASDMKSMDQDQRDFVLALAERLRG